MSARNKLFFIVSCLVAVSTSRSRVVFSRHEDELIVQIASQARTRRAPSTVARLLHAAPVS